MEQVVPCAIQGLSQPGQYTDGRKFLTALDFLKKPAADIALLDQLFLGKPCRGSQPVHVVAELSTEGVLHGSTISGNVHCESALSRAFSLSLQMQKHNFRTR